MSDYQPPEVAKGKLVGFPRKSKNNQSYMSLFYRDEDGKLHSLSVFRNESKEKPGVVYYKGMGEEFSEASSGETEEA